MGTLYAIGVSSGDIGAAIAESIIHDVRVNGLGIQGFPQITVAHPSKVVFAIGLKFDGYESGFTITADEAKRAVRTMKGGKGQDAAIRSEEHTTELQSLLRITYAVSSLK